MTLHSPAPLGPSRPAHSVWGRLGFALAFALPLRLALGASAGAQEGVPLPELPAFKDLFFYINEDFRIFCVAAGVSLWLRYIGLRRKNYLMRKKYREHLAEQAARARDRLPYPYQP